MVVETLARQFYKHEAYTATRYALYIALEQWLSKLVFRRDTTRVYLASDEYAFRRRFELTDTSQSYDQVQASSLRFPFANYWPGNDGWRPDERAAANTAALVVVGLSENTRTLRAMAVTSDITTTFYFDREDDARLAYEFLLWNAFREQLMYTTVQWKDEILSIPLNIKIQDLTFNPDYKEKNWLEEQRIFTISARLELRSHIPQPPEQPEYASDISVVDNERYVLTEEVILDMLSESKIVSTLQIDTLFNQNPTILVNQFGVASTSPTTARLTWDIEAPDLASVELIISGRDPVKIVDPTIKDYTFRKLEEASDYTVTMTIMDNRGVSKVVALKFSTPLSDASARVKTSDRNTLVGTSW